MRLNTPPPVYSATISQCEQKEPNRTVPFGPLQEQPERTSVLKTFPVRGWVIVIFMMCLGMALKIIGVPVAFTASFYSGLGPALLTAAILFLKK